MKNLSELVSEGFIQGVGITRPRAGKERNAARYITGLIALTIVGALSFFFLVLSHIG